MPTRRFALATLLAAGLCAGLAQAQPRPPAPDARGGGRGPANGPQGHRPPAAPQPRRAPQPRHGHGPRPPADRGPGIGPERRFHRGDRLPADYRSRHYVIDDWRAYRLSAPPRGHRWIQVGADFALVAIATGLIAQIVLGH